jgi:ferredoxin
MVPRPGRLAEWSRAGRQAAKHRSTGHTTEGIPLTGDGIRFCSRFTMANKADKWETNAAGRFYVDQQCIDCDLCRETAPAFFTRSEEGGYSFVSKQPTTEEDLAACMEALEGCPVEAIGNDGD